MKKYEVMYILRSNLDQETIKGEIAKVNDLFTNNDSKVLEVKEWGLRELAYEIEKSRKGYYVWMLVEATPVAVSEFNRIAGYNENIIRSIVVVDGVTPSITPSTLCLVGGNLLAAPERTNKLRCTCIVHSQVCCIVGYEVVI